MWVSVQCSPMRDCDCCFYYEEIKRELNRILTYECRCDERLRVKTEGPTRLAYTGLSVVEERGSR